jgi:hypothetical protein
LPTAGADVGGEVSIVVCFSAMKIEPDSWMEM